MSQSLLTFTASLLVQQINDFYQRGSMACHTSSGIVITDLSPCLSAIRPSVWLYCFVTLGYCIKRNKADFFTDGKPGDSSVLQVSGSSRNLKGVTASEGIK